RRDGDAEADVEIVPGIGLVLVRGQDELLARRHQEGALVLPGPQVVKGQNLAIAVEAALEVFRLLAAILDHPGDKTRLVGEGRPHVAAEWRRGPGRKRREADGRANQKFASVHETLLARPRAGPRRLDMDGSPDVGRGRLIGWAADKISPQSGCKRRTPGL